MGQRLVVTIKNNKKELAKIYYHWGGYTDSALLHTEEIISCIYNHEHETESDMLLRLIHFCEENGGGITGTENATEYNYIQALYPNETFKTEDIDRNNGIIALSKNGMDSMQKWSEGDVDINIDTDKVDFYVYSGYEDLEEYIEERKSWDDEFNEKELKNLPMFNFCLGMFDVSDINAIIASLDSVGNDGVIICANEVCELIC